MNTSFKLNDMILIITLIILSLMPLLFNINSNEKIAEIKLNGKIFKTINLSVNETFMIKTDAGYNVIKIENEAISIIEADCPDNICVKTGAIKDVNKVIACIPHKLLINITSDSKTNHN